jgi:hypothetical protein
LKWFRSTLPEIPATLPVLVYCQKLQNGAPAGRVPGALAHRASHSGWLAHGPLQLPVQLVHQLVVV